MRWVIALSGAAWILIGAVVVGVWGAKSLTSPARSQAVGAKGDAELARCRMLGEAAKDDATCRIAWASARAHFFDGGVDGGRP
jgi:conjugative transfer region protein TrbK